MRKRTVSSAWTRPLAVGWALAALAGCATVFPPQTASTVEPGAYRLGGSLAYVQWCGVTGDPLAGCYLSPRGVPLPEVRLSARHGVREGTDLGASAHASGALTRGAQGGLYVDLKQELWSQTSPGGSRRIVSLAPGIGYTAIALTPTHGSVRIAVVDLGVPLYLGLQGDTVEWVFGLRYLERLSFQNEDDVPGRDLRATGEAGASVGLVRRRSPHLALELTYQSPVDRPLGGLFLLSAGVSFDVAPEEPGAE